MEANRLDAWLWLDGPAQPEGQVGGDARVLLRIETRGNQPPPMGYWLLGFIEPPDPLGD